MKKVLVIEPDPILCELICSCLREAGLEPRACEAERAAGLALELPASSIVLALAGAQLDRTPLYRLLRDNPRTAGIPLVLYTGHRHATVRRRLNEKPAYVVFKPFEPEYLAKIVLLSIKENEEGRGG